MTTRIPAATGFEQLTAPGALGGAQAGEPKDVVLLNGRWLVQVSNVAWLTQTGTAPLVKGVQLSPLAENVVIDVEGAGVTWFVRARSALDVEATFTRVG